MVDSGIIRKYFPGMEQEKFSRFEKLYDIYAELNSEINVISRKDIEELYTRHVLHSLALCKFIEDSVAKTVLDFGTGGGFPGIPLAIYFPEIRFHLVDSIGKKIQVIEAVKERLDIKNVKAEKARVEEVKGVYDLVVNRAVTRMANFYPWIKKNLHAGSRVLCLKGGDLLEEIQEFKLANRNKTVSTHPIREIFKEEFFETKVVLEIF